MFINMVLDEVYTHTEATYILAQPPGSNDKKVFPLGFAGIQESQGGIKVVHIGAGEVARNL